jgi:hypothetical protein
MPNSDPTTARQPGTDLRALKWSAKDKAVARCAFDLALKQELDNMLREVKDKVSSIEEASELWELERWLAQRRQKIDRQFDFRYSVLLHVFASLLRERRLIDDDLQGLSQDKLTLIRQLAAR